MYLLASIALFLHLHAWRSSRRRRRFQSDVGDFSLTSSIRRGLATTWFRQDFVDQVQLVQEPNGRLERTVEPHIGCGVTAWIKIMFTAGCSREAMLFIAPRRLPSITLRVIGVSLSKFSFWWAVAKTICVIPRGWPSSNGKNETPWHALRHVFAYEFIYYRATVIFENRFVVPSAFER